MTCGGYIGIDNTSMRKLELVAVLIIGLCLSGHCEELHIVVAGDGRADFPWSGNDTRPEDKDGLNQTVTGEICKEAKQQNAQVLLWTGDIVNVNQTAGCKAEDKTNFLRRGLDRWLEIMGPLYKDKVNKVKVLPVRGNHEVEWYEQLDWTPNPIANATVQWLGAFKDLDLPNNGPDGEKDLSFYLVDDSMPALFIGLDQYENRRHLVNQSWLDQVLDENKKKWKKPFIFVYGHEPAFVTGGSHPSQEDLAAYPRIRDRMWESLANAGARAVYFCGHDHFYDRMKVQREDVPEMYQITAGTAGAPFTGHNDYPKDEDWVLEQVKHIDSVYGYVLITINGNKDEAKIEFKGRNLDCTYQTRDSLIVTRETP